jgi:hypothetical protein
MFQEKEKNYRDNIAVLEDKIKMHDNKVFKKLQIIRLENWTQRKYN